METITTIELSSDCNMRCQYCVQPMYDIMGRKREIMPDDIFDRTLEVLAELCRRGSQREVNMNGNGESLLDPQLIERVRRVKDVMGFRPVNLCTNGALLTHGIAQELKDAGLDRLDVSPHSAYHARKAIPIIRAVGLAGICNHGTIEHSHNWAGQLPSQHAIPIMPELRALPCHPLIEGRGYVLTDGRVTPCCYDYRGLGTYGHIADSDIADINPRPYALCATCHQVIPAGMFEEIAA